MPPNPSSHSTAPRSSYDALIFGGGLAGSLLAERFLASEKRVLLVDDPSKSSCSRVAAGLINPIGGKRLKRVWRAEDLLPHALEAYCQLEAKLKTTIFHPRPIARLFANTHEAQLWQKRIADPAYLRQTRSLSALSLPKAFSSDSGFAVMESGYLDTSSLIERLRDAFRSRSALLEQSFRYEDIEIGPDSIRYQEHRAPIAVFAEGHLATRNPWFSFAPYKPAKGLIATVRLSPEHARDFCTNSPIVIKSKFIVPRHDGRLIVGATYRWDDATDSPDPEGEAELADFLDDHFGSGNWSFESVQAGVRPATAGAYPIVGPHPTLPQLLSFNGFGSKGSLQIPFFADALLERIYENKDLPPEVLPKRFIKAPALKPRRWIATEVVREVISHHVNPGETAIDATAGNGHDTVWLCESVGASGHVFAFDLQAPALEITRGRLRKSSLAKRATLMQRGHETMLDSIPPEHRGGISAIVFNLGFLPGGDLQVVTQPKTTLQALDASMVLLKPGGMLSITLYPSHPGGQEEVDEVLIWIQRLASDQAEVCFERHPTGNRNSPYPVFIKKRSLA
ncbi:FAD-dependent oxidoreductase [Pelagicoccus sp. SDUM812003]|uniref:FAD-dependent oxidoreductase n=1 Tax=Pelagicoccus sp. SDUM812003 TaxID=3041267 RepID=UPI00280D6F60|nr:FAD-dependent oxidoreductase [Pelagicoccus sp. SDUM812003]MDQ8205561.1 FAD-dependent oxidoreductase [Pelagicoccus sp. SDUM812003]